MAWLRTKVGQFGGLWLARPFSCLMILVIGGALSFGYSYVPLHAAKERRVERLEGELAREAGRGLALAERLAEIELQARLAPASDELDGLRSERRHAQQRISDLETRVSKAERRASEHERARTKYQRRAATYKKQVEELTAERDALLVARRSPARNEQPVARVSPNDGPALAGMRPPDTLAPDSRPEAQPRPKLRGVSPDRF